MKKSNENDHLIAYEVNHFNIITNELLDKHYSEEKSRHIAFFSSVDEYENLDSLAKRVDKDRYFIQTGFQKVDPQVLGNENHEVTSKVFETKEEMIELSLKTLNEFFSKEWGDYVTEEMINEYKHYFQTVFTPEQSLGVWYKGELVGLTNLFPSEDGLGRKVTQMGWGWVSPELDKTLRSAVHHELTKFYAQNKGRYQAGTHIFNKRSQNFLKKIGYECLCVHILKK